MKKIIPLLMSSGLLLIMSSCKQDKKAGQQTAVTKDLLNIRTEKVSISALKGDYCFMKAENKDTTSVHLTISGDQVKGKMTWQPWEKDGAAGTLSGKLISDNEIEVLYDYTIEGSKQTETKIMKIDQDKLYIKIGELTDPKNKGNLIYKDHSKAVYSEVLDSVPCK